MNKGLLNIHEICIRRQLSFVSFRLPGEACCRTYVQQGPGCREADQLDALTGARGFLFAPFDTRNGHRFLQIRPDLDFHSSEIGPSLLRKIEQLPSSDGRQWSLEKPVVTEREAYLEQVESIRNSIATGAFQKAVLSRIHVVDGDYLPIVPQLYQTLCKQHPNAFSYLFSAGPHFWMGASPEPLLRLRDGKVSTVSLAGTRPCEDCHMDVNKWTMKEVLEQEYVTRYIHDVLREFLIRDYRVSSPYVKKAGSLLHLCSDFNMDFEKLNGRLWDLVEALHPTPAVAGQPKEEAIRFIKALEAHDRDYYTGFLGPVNPGESLDLFVNLRCMKIHPERLSLYVGGGITLESDPADEWDETSLKAASLLKYLKAYMASN